MDYFCALWASQAIYTGKHTTSLDSLCYISPSYVCVCCSISQRGEIVESTAALYGCENIPTHWQRGSSDFLLLLLHHGWKKQRGAIVGAQVFNTN